MCTPIGGRNECVLLYLFSTIAQITCMRRRYQKNRDAHQNPRFLWGEASRYRRKAKAFQSLIRAEKRGTEGAGDIKLEGGGGGVTHPRDINIKITLQGAR